MAEPAKRAKQDRVERHAEAVAALAREKLKREGLNGGAQPPPAPFPIGYAAPAVLLPAAEDAFDLAALRSSREERRDRHERYPIGDTGRFLYVFALLGPERDLLMRWNAPYLARKRTAEAKKAPAAEVARIEDEIIEPMMLNKVIVVSRTGPRRGCPYAFAPELASNPAWAPDGARLAEVGEVFTAGEIGGVVEIAHRLSQVFDPQKEDLEAFFATTRRFFGTCASAFDGWEQCPSGLREDLQACVSLAARLSLRDPSRSVA